jgi:hypothetical protein
LATRDRLSELPAAPGAKVKPDNLCTASECRKKIAANSLCRFVVIMRWARMFLYFYIAQAAIGAAIGFAFPLLHLVAG